MKISGWGRYPVIDAEMVDLRSVVAAGAKTAASRKCIARGLGRSYGDSSLADRVITTLRANRIYSFDAGTGLLTCEAGLSLDDIVSVFLPRGWFLEITPGTRFVTVGGAIASDVHGKNHHVAGCFSESVLAFHLLLPGGEVVTCSREENRELFLATCGGMGLTGIILDAVIRLRKVDSALIEQQTFSAANLTEAFTLFEQHGDWPYSVAWIDCLARGGKKGRSILMVGEHAAAGSLDLPPKKKVTVPFSMPGMLLNRYTVSAFNELYHAMKTKKASREQVDLHSFFYPLDSLLEWNRIYGGTGFTQYQFVLPLESSREGLSAILDQIADSGQGSFLAVLKLFGRENENYLSFPREGYTLALDFKITRNLFPLLDRLDSLVLDFGGRLYLTKDARMKPAMLRAGYPSLARFEQVREKIGADAVFHSKQSMRLEL